MTMAAEYERFAAGTSEASRRLLRLDIALECQ